MCNYIKVGSRQHLFIVNDSSHSLTGRNSNLQSWKLPPTHSLNGRQTLYWQTKTYSPSKHWFKQHIPSMQSHNLCLIKTPSIHWIVMLQQSTIFICLEIQTPQLVCNKIILPYRLLTMFDIYKHYEHQTNSIIWQKAMTYWHILV